MPAGSVEGVSGGGSPPVAVVPPPPLARWFAPGMRSTNFSAVGLVMTAILLIGLIVREQKGPGRIGLESSALLLVYAGAVAVQAFMW